MGLSLKKFKEGKEVIPGAPRLKRKGLGRKKDEGRPKWVPTTEEIKNWEYKKKLIGTCWNCILWNWHFGNKSGDIKRCPVRGIMVAGYMGCRGYFRTRL